jgi:hypothetical protein
VLQKGWTKSMTGKTTEGTAWGASKRAMPSRDGGILLTWEYLSFYLNFLPVNLSVKKLN